MNAYPHLLIGASAGLIAGTLVGEAPLPVAAIGGLAALAPDLDVGTSTGSRLLRNGVAIAAVAAGVVLANGAFRRTHDGTALVAGALGAVVVWAVLMAVQPSNWARHRGPFHTILAGLVAGGIVAFLQPHWGLVAAVGWWSHLAADDFTHKGQPLLWPLMPCRRLVHVVPRGLRFRSGAWVEWPMAAAIVALAVRVTGLA